MKRRCLWLLSVWLLFTCAGFAISEARAAVLPYFQYCNVMSSNTPSGVSTVLGAEVFYPNPEASAITSVSVVGPGGFTATMTTSDYDPSANLFKKEISGQPTAGEYKFTVVDTLGGSAVSYYRLGNVTILPIVDSTTFVAYGDPLAPTLCWSDVSGYNGNLLFVAVILDSNDNMVWVSSDPTTLPGTPTGLTNVTVPPGKLELRQCLQVACHRGGQQGLRGYRQSVQELKGPADNRRRPYRVFVCPCIHSRQGPLRRGSRSFDTKLVFPAGASSGRHQFFCGGRSPRVSYSFQPSDLKSGNNFYHESPDLFPTGMYTFTVVLQDQGYGSDFPVHIIIS